jgi:hypothetical protein
LTGVSPSIDELLTQAQGAYARGDLHAAAAAWRQVLIVEPAHGPARGLLTQVEAELEASLHDAFEVVTEAQRDLMTGDAAAGGVDGLMLPESEVELSEMADMEAYDTGEVPAVTPEPATPARSEVAPQRSGTLGWAREDTNPGGVVPGFGGAPAEAPPTRSSRPLAGVLAGDDDPDEALRADEAALDALFDDFDDSSEGTFTPEPSPSPPSEAPPELSQPVLPAKSAPEVEAFDPLAAMENSPDQEAASGAPVEPEPFEQEPMAPEPLEPEPLEPEPIDPGEDTAEDVIDAFDPFGAFASTAEDQESPADDSEAAIPSDAEVLGSMLRAVPPEDDEDQAISPDADHLVEPIGDLPELEADPSDNMIIDAMPEGPKPEHESWPEFTSSPLPIAEPDRSAPTSDAEARSLSGVTTRTRTLPPRSVVENSRSGSRVDLFSGRNDAEASGDTMEFSSEPGDEIGHGLAAAVAAFQQGDAIGAYDVVSSVVVDEPDNSGAADFLERIRAETERALLTRIGPVDAAPSLAVSAAGLTGLSLDHKAGFVLSQIDGFVSFEDIVDLSGMARLATLRILVRLLDASVVTR